MIYFDYHQGRIQAYFESVEPSDHRLYVYTKKNCYLKFSLKNCFSTMISPKYFEEVVS